MADRDSQRGRESISPSRSPPAAKRKSSDHSDNIREATKSLRRDGVLSLEFDDADDEELCKAGDVSLSVPADFISKSELSLCLGVRLLPLLVPSM